MEDQTSTIISMLKSISEDTSLIKNINQELSVNQTDMAQLKVNIASIFARIDVLEKMLSSNTTTTKRSIKVADKPVVSDTNLFIDDNVSESSLKSKNVTNVEYGDEKILNTLTFFKKIVMFKNYNNGRDRYKDGIIECKPTVKKPEDTEAFWVSIGNNIWKTLNKNDKKEVLEEYKKWKSERQLDGQNQLDTDTEVEAALE